MKQKQGRFERIFMYAGMGIACVFALIADAPFWGAILLLFLAGVGVLIGSMVDQACKEDKPLKSIRKPLFVIIFIVILCLSLFNMCTYEKPVSTTQCPNCGTLMESQYIKSYGCSRCDGHDWD